MMHTPLKKNDIFKLILLFKKSFYPNFLAFILGYTRTRAHARPFILRKFLLHVFNSLYLLTLQAHSYRVAPVLNLKD